MSARLAIGRRGGGWAVRRSVVSPSPLSQRDAPEGRRGVSQLVVTRATPTAAQRGPASSCGSPPPSCYPALRPPSKHAPRAERRLGRKRVVVAPGGWRRVLHAAGLSRARARRIFGSLVRVGHRARPRAIWRDAPPRRRPAAVPRPRSISECDVLCSDCCQVFRVNGVEDVPFEFVRAAPHATGEIGKTSTWRHCCATCYPSCEPYCCDDGWVRTGLWR